MLKAPIIGPDFFSLSLSQPPTHVECLNPFLKALPKRNIKQTKKITTGTFTVNIKKKERKKITRIIFGKSVFDSNKKPIMSKFIILQDTVFKA